METVGGGGTGRQARLWSDPPRPRPSWVLCLKQSERESPFVAAAGVRGELSGSAGRLTPLLGTAAQRRGRLQRVQVPASTTDAVSLFPSFFCLSFFFWCCVREVDADSFREGGGVFCVRVHARARVCGRGRTCGCVSCVCWLAFQIMKCSREQRAGGPYSLCCSFIFTPVSL